VGTVYFAFIGELDPYVVGDVCILFVDVAAGGAFDAGAYGLIERDPMCTFTARFGDRRGATVRVAAADLEAVTAPEALRELEDFEPARYYDLDGPVT